MVHKIIVALDGSTFAESALPTAFHLARRDAATVQLVLVQDDHP
jgi:nucleotide-binding universal stress UspA family protein